MSPASLCGGFGGKGFKQAIADDQGLRQVNATYQGHITSQPVAEGLNKDLPRIYR